MKPCDHRFQDLHDINDWAGDKPKTITAFKLKVIDENFITKKYLQRHFQNNLPNHTIIDAKILFSNNF